MSRTLGGFRRLILDDDGAETWVSPEHVTSIQDKGDGSSVIVMPSESVRVRGSADDVRLALLDPAPAKSWPKRWLGRTP